jgi:crotonobetainyl-CoA:carnitine CoA-transferase CaiB-like acyl-CoA transferase
MPEKTALLAGFRVLDLTNVLAGPYACYQLTLLGADVIKVEAPEGGDLARQLGASPELNRAGMGVSFLAQNAGKRSVVLDLKRADGKGAFLDLVATADALVENFRPGVMERLGLKHDRLREAKPDLFYCAISGFGQTGPLRDNPAYDQIIQGLSGVMSITGTPSPPFCGLAHQAAEHEHVEAMHRQAVAALQKRTGLLVRQGSGTEWDARAEDHSL